jgi:uncharacterized protein (TIGR00251 family)
MPYLQTLPDGSLLLRLLVQPKASRNEIAGLHDNALKLRLTTPPIEGRANKAVIAFIAKLLHLPKSSVTIRSGLQNRNKELLISGGDEQRVRQILLGKSGNDSP